ncbi:hypothetical protein [Faecalitalea cylindroides]
MSEKKFNCVEFDDDKKQLEILNGTSVTINYDDIAKVSILNEEAKFRGKSKPFSHQVLGGTTFYTIFGEPRFYVGLKIVLKDKSEYAAYISDRITGLNTDIYHEDVKEAETIKQMIDKRITK